MKQGTISIFFGCHSPIHSIFVLISWIKLYKSFPKFWQLVCIFLHDVGHFGKNYLDNVDEKRDHWRGGAMIAERLFNTKGFLFIAGHCGNSGYGKSKLYKADKYSWYIAPVIVLLSNQIFEPKLKMGYTALGAVRAFKARVKESIESGEYRSTHDFYLERCGGKKETRADGARVYSQEKENQL